MKKQFLLFTFLLSFIMAACQQSSSKVINEAVDAAAFSKLINERSDEQLLDVRTPEEYDGGHIAGALNLNIYDEVFRQTLGKLDPARPVMVYCKAGGRSADAAGILKEMGFKEVYDLKGGMMAWDNAGLPVERKTAASSAGITLKQYEQLVTQQPLILVDFNAVWCKPCKMLAPILDELVKKENGRLTLIKLDADQNPELLKAKGIEGIPYLELYKEGKLVWSNMGLTDEATIAAQLK